MKGFRVESQQLGTAQTETMAHPGQCRHFGHATKLRSFKGKNTHEDFGFGGTFETKVTPSRGFRVVPGGESRSQVSLNEALPASRAGSTVSAGRLMTGTSAKTLGGCSL